MKISQMTNDQAADALVRMTEPISNIMADKDAIPIMQRFFDESKSDNPLEGIASVLMQFVPFCLKNHRKDLFTIIAALDGRDGKDMGKFSFMATLRVLRDSMDKDLLDFFKESGVQATNAGKESV